MKLDLSKPVQTRNGHKARIFCTDLKGKRYPIAGAVEIGKNKEDMRCWTADGKQSYGVDDSPGDLVNVSHKFWTNVYYRNDGKGFSLGDLHKEEDTAKACAHGREDKAACIEIEFKEGEGL